MIFPRTVDRIDFMRVAKAALEKSEILVPIWLPNGKRQGNEWTALNPTRLDKRVGSFRINLKTGKWADFAVDACGRDLISLAAYLNGTSQRDAALYVAELIGIHPNGW